MSTPERQLRLVQVACLLFVAVCIFVRHLVKRETQSAITPTQWLVIVAAIWSAVSGFTGQRRIVSARTRSQRASRRSTPFSRWRAGHLMRLWTATIVALWALVLHEIGGPSRLVDTFFAVGLLLLLVWRPGASPTPTPPWTSRVEVEMRRF